MKEVFDLISLRKIDNKMSLKNLRRNFENEKTKKKS